MSVIFVHTADWQLGKPFAGVKDGSKRVLLQQARLDAIKQIGNVARERVAAFVLVAGDLFDSPRATKATVAAACSAIGSIGVPVIAIPGNHDHGGAGSLWEQEFYLREREQLAPNFHVLLAPEPFELESAVIFPCPLLRRQDAADPTAWLRSMDGVDFGDKARIVLAHGTVLDFGAVQDDEELDAGAPNFVDLEQLTNGRFDYIALGDWHGTRQMADNAWYAGAPEADRFVKGEEHDPGNVLVVEVSRGGRPRVERIRTGAIGWHTEHCSFADDADLERLEALIGERIGTRVDKDLIRLRLQGHLGIEAAARLEQKLEAWEARCIRVKLDDQTSILPSATELGDLTDRMADPLISRVAVRLAAMATGEGEAAVVARLALRELYAACAAD